ncbi:hypothetical protein ACJX0J_008269, partial [Zea mays]
KNGWIRVLTNGQGGKKMGASVLRLAISADPLFQIKLRYENEMHEAHTNEGMMDIELLKKILIYTLFVLFLFICTFGPSSLSYYLSKSNVLKKKATIISVTPRWIYTYDIMLTCFIIVTDVILQQFFYSVQYESCFHQHYMQQLFSLIGITVVASQIQTMPQIL